MDAGTVGGRYRLDERLGVGGMAEVWAAEDLELGRRVALKLLGQEADAARFEREARAVAALAHPNICQLYDYGEDQGRRFMVLEYLGGGTLEDRLVPGEAHPDDETARIAHELALGLAHAHERGLIHRDLKPGNVLFDEEGRAKIADFGIARIGGAGTLTEAGTLLGTAAYISPEQAQGLPATAASDVYSFGVVLYRMLTGRLPFESDSAIELASMHVTEQPPPLEAIRPDAPAKLAAIAEAALAKDPGSRPPDGAALVEALGDPGTTMSEAPTLVVDAAPVTVVPRARRQGPAARRNLVPLLLAAALAVGGAGAAIAILASRDSDDSGPPPASAGRRSRPKTTTGSSTTTPTRRTSTTAETTTTPSTAATTTVPAPAPPPPATTPPPPPPPPPPTTAPTTATTVPTTTPVTTTTPPPPPAP